MAEDGIGVTACVVGAIGCIVVGKYLSRWESKLDRHIVCSELDQFVDQLEENVETPDQLRELNEIRRGVDQVRRGQIPFDDGPGFMSSLWDKSKSLAGAVNPAKLWRGGSNTESNGKADTPADPPAAPAEA